MAIASHPLSQLLFLSICLSIAYSDCPADTRVPRFYKTQLNMAMMRPERVPPGSSRHASHYVHNYPVELITRSFSTNIDSLISVNKLEVEGITNSINFKAKQIKSQTSLLVSLYYYDSNWKNCALVIVLFDKSTYPSLSFGEISATNTEKRLQLSLSSKLPQNFKDSTAKSVTILNGINVQRNKQSDFLYEIQLVDKIDLNAGLVWVTVTVGESNLLNEINLVYIVYAESPNYEAFGSYASFENVGSGMHNAYLGDGFMSSPYFFAGISSFKIKKGPGSFYLQFKEKSNSQNSIELQSNEPIQILKLAIFKIGNNPINLCANCPQKVIANVAPSTTCVQTCSEGSQMDDPIRKVARCIVCPAELNRAMVGGKCQCMPSFTNSNGQCLTPVETKLVSGNLKPTFSRSDSDCVDPNSYMASDRTCQCKLGYSKKEYFNIFQCEPICNSGYYNGQTCISCPVGTYPRNELQTCLPCCNDCVECKSQFACKQCSPGFQTNSTGQCQEICGDGIRISAQCDDGNAIDGDGCSAQCAIENGFNCSPDPQGKSVCNRIDYQVTRKELKFLSGNLILQYEMVPPPARLYGPSQIQDKVKIKFLKTPPYQSYIVHNPANLSSIRVVGNYAGNVPTTPINIEVKIQKPNGEFFQEVITKNFGSDGVMFSRRGFDASKDTLK